MVVAVPPAPDAGRRRSRGRTARRSGRLLGAVTGLVLLAGAVGAASFVPTPEDEQTILTYTGAVQEEVSAGRFSARVNSVALARSLKSENTMGEPVEIATDHIFLIVNASATVPRDPINLAGVFVSGGDQLYAPTDKVETERTLLNTFIQPGWWTTGIYVFEVRRDALAGSSVQMHMPDTVLTESDRPGAEIDLGLDEAAVKNLVAKATDSYDLAPN